MTEEPTPIPTEELEEVTGGKLPPGIDEAWAEGEKAAQHRRRHKEAS